jgi:hypothetical protein
VNCDYCGPRAVACWLVEVYPDDTEPITRRVCSAHVDAARGHLAQLGFPNITEINHEQLRSLV